MADAIQDEHEATFEFIEEVLNLNLKSVHNCPAVWDISIVALKDT